MKSKALFFLVVMLFAITGYAAQYYTERFENLNKCDIIKTTGDWHLIKDYWDIDDSTYGSGGGASLPETTYVSVAGIPVSFAARGPFVYICGKDGNFMIYRVDSMRTVSNFTADARDVDVQGNFAYLCVGGNTLKILSIYNPYSIQERASLTVKCLAIAVRGTYAYIAADDAGLIAVDISDTSNPTPVDTATWGATRSAVDISLFGDYAFVLDASGKTLVSVNISDPTNLGTPNLMSPSYATTPRRFFISGTKAYVSLQDVISVVNIANPTTMTRNSREQPALKLTGSSAGAAGVSKWGQWLFVANNDSGIVTYECAGGDSFLHIRSTTPLYAGTPPSLQPALDMVVVNRYMAVSDSVDMTIRKLFTISPATSFDDSAVIGDVAVDFVIIGKRLYVTDQFLGLITIDISNPSDIRAIDTLSIPYTRHATVGICNWGTDLYIAAGAAGVVKASAPDPDNPTLDWQENLNWSEVYDVATDGKYIYAATISGTKGVIKLRASDHTPVDTLVLSEPVFGIVYDNGYIFLAANRLGLISVKASSGPTDTMEILDTIPATGSARAWDVGIEWPIVAVAMEQGGLKIVDVKNPRSMSEIATIGASNIGRTFGVSVSNNFVFVASTDRVRVIDLKNPSTIAATSPASVLPEFARQYGEYVIFSDYSGGIKTWRFGQAYPLNFKESSLLYSKELAGGSDYNRVNWSALEFIADGDTTDYWLLFGTSPSGPSDSFLIINHAQEPPPLPGGGESWYEIEATYQYLWWKGTFSVTNTTAPPLTRVDTIRIGWDYLAKKAFLVPINIEFQTDTITLYFGVDSFATAGYDPGLDEPYSPLAYNDAYFRIEDPLYPSIRYLRKNIINIKDQNYEFELVVNGPPCVIRWEPDSIPIGNEFRLAGLDMRRTREYRHSGHGIITLSVITSGTPWFIKSIYPGWNMVSVSAGETRRYSDIFQGIVNYPYEYDPLSRRFVRAENVVPGKGYFVLARKATSFRYQGNPILRARYELQRGWNIIGCIHKRGFNWSDVQVDPPGSILQNIYTYDPTTHNYIETETGEFGKAYWVFAHRQCTITLGIQSSRLEKDYTPAIPKTPEYYLLIISDNGEKLVAGVDKDASSGFEPSFDFPTLPPVPDRSTKAYFENAEVGFNLSKDIRNLLNTEWNLRVEQPTEFTFDTRSLPYNANVFIETNDTRITIKNNSRIRLDNGTYKLVIEAEYALPKQVVLYGAYPNPFNQATTISFGIPANGKTKLVIFNTLGQEIKTLIDQNLKAGYHRVIWDGTDNLSNSVPSGVYFCALKSGSDIRTQKITLIK